MDASGFEDEMKCDETFVHLEVRQITSQLIGAYQNLFTSLTDKRADRNHFASGLRIFKHNKENIGFPLMDDFIEQFGRILSSLYIFKFFHPQSDGYTHGIYVRLTGYAHRGAIEKFLSEITVIFCGNRVDLRAVVPCVKKEVSLFDYLQGLYVKPTNLIVSYSNRKDALNQEDYHIDHTSIDCLKDRIQKLTTTILDNIVTMPNKYPNTYMSRFLQMTQDQYKICMKQTTLNEICMYVAQDAYGLALQDKHFKVRDVQELLAPITRRSIIHRCIAEKTTKQIQFLIQSTFDSVFIHPHIYSNLAKGKFNYTTALEPMLFDARFMFPLIMVARWFSKTCMRQESYLSNNQAHLVLYGSAGTGKSLIACAISSCVNTYKYLSGSKFQNPDLLQSSLILMEEFDTQQLVLNHYKQLLDLKSSVKIDFKNLHPESVTEAVPCIITTNDDILSVLKAQKKANSASADAALRRLYIVPMKLGVFEKIHYGRVQPDSPRNNQLAQFDGRFVTEDHLLQRLMSIIMGIALFQHDTDHLYLDQRLQPYFSKMAKEFHGSLFGAFYLTNKGRIDEMMISLEDFMKKADINDSEYHGQMALQVGQYQQLIQQFLLEMTVGTIIDQGVVKDNSIPWPIRIYYLFTNHQFVAKLMLMQAGPYTTSLNPEVKRFLESQDIMPYSVAKEDETISLDDIAFFQPGEPFQEQEISLLGKRSAEFDIDNTIN